MTLDKRRFLRHKNCQFFIEMGICDKNERGKYAMNRYMDSSFVTKMNSGEGVTAVTDDIDLISDVEDGIMGIDIESLEALLERSKAELKRKEILSGYQLKQLPSGAWYIKINGKKVQRNNRKDLEDYIVQREEKSQYTLVSIYEKYLSSRKKEVENTTWQKDVRYYNMYISTSEMAQIPLEELKLDDGYKFLEHCKGIKKDLKRKYWNGVLGTVQTMFQYAIDRGIICRNPFANLKPKADYFAPATKIRDADTVFTCAEQSQVCAIAENEAYQENKSEPLGIVLLFNLGLRIGELCALRWGDLEDDTGVRYIHVQREMVTNISNSGDVDGNVVLEHCKTPAGDRRLLLNTKCVELFQKIREINIRNNLPVGQSDYIFLRWVRGAVKFCTPRSFDPRLRRYCKKAGMGVVKSAHDVRRTVFTNLYKVRMPMKKIQEFAGHASLRQTMDYIRVSDDDITSLQFLEQLSSLGSDKESPLV